MACGVVGTIVRETDSVSPVARVCALGSPTAFNSDDCVCKTCPYYKVCIVFPRFPSGFSVLDIRGDRLIRSGA